MKKVLVVIVLLLIVAGAGFCGYKYLKHKHNEELNTLQQLYEGAQSQIETLEIQNENLLNPPKVEITVKTLKEYIAPASELITYKYFYTDAGTYEKSQTIGKTDIKIPFSTDKVVYTYSGTISAGIDVGDIKFAVDDKNMKITVAMPQPKILAHELDENSFQTYDVKNSVFTSSDLKDYADFSKSLKDTQEDKLMSNEVFWNNVKGNAEGVIRGLITANDEVDDYSLDFNWVDK